MRCTLPRRPLPTVMALALWLAVALAPPASAATARSNAEILRNFDLIAFNTEDGRHTPHVLKWQGPVRLYLHGQDRDGRFQAEVEAFLVELGRLTGLEMGFVADEADANVNLYYMSKAELVRTWSAWVDDPQDIRDIVYANECFAFPSARRFEIRAALMAIPTYRSKARRRACIVEEITQVLGLFNDDDRVVGSVFNDSTPVDELTDHDRLLVRLLYDPRLVPGMPRAQALALAAQILDEWRPGL